MDEDIYASLAAGKAGRAVAATKTYNLHYAAFLLFTFQLLQQMYIYLERRAFVVVVGVVAATR